MQPIKRNLIDQNAADAAAATTGLLNELARRLHLGAEESVPSVTVTGISCDPEEIRPGDLYVALRRRAPGSVGAAIGRGAVAVVSEESLKADLGVPVVRVQDEVRARPAR